MRPDKVSGAISQRFMIDLWWVVFLHVLQYRSGIPLSYPACPHYWQLTHHVQFSSNIHRMIYKNERQVQKNTITVNGFLKQGGLSLDSIRWKTPSQSSDNLQCKLAQKVIAKTILILHSVSLRHRPSIWPQSYGEIHCTKRREAKHMLTNLPLSQQDCGVTKMFKHKKRATEVTLCFNRLACEELV